MLPTRFAPAQSSAMRKSRLEGKPSMLPKPRRHGSTDRLSSDARRSTATHRSSSAEPSRPTYAGGRLSREASNTNLPMNSVSIFIYKCSKLEGKPSMLPKPRRHGSTDRLSSDARRSTATHRSSSAEPSRPTYAGGRLSREASNTNLPMNSRSRSQQSERFGQSSMTPLRSSHFSRPTTTPVRTPSEDRRCRSWQASLDRALAFVTVKDQRPISNVGWQRAELARVQAALMARAGGSGAGGLALVRPLTIARFVDITAALLSVITRDKLNNDNYVTKLPHLSKRLLYPATVSKSWLKTVNTLHAFPHALALIAYLLDLVNDLEMPVLDEWLYADKDEQSCLRRDFLNKCFIRFQDPGHQFEDLNQEYLQNLKILLGNNEEKIMELEQLIKKYQLCLEDEVEAAARAEEAQRAERRAALLAALRAQKVARRATRADIDAQRAIRHDWAEEIRQLDVDIERANAESQQLRVEVESQLLSVADRTRLRDEVDYAHRVSDSKRALAEQIAKMVLSKEAELTLWQKRTLDSCVQYKQGLIHLSAQFPQLSTLAIDEKELMGVECGTAVRRAVDALREVANSLADRRNDIARQKTALARKRALLLEEGRASVCKVQTSIHAVQQALEAELQCEAAESADWHSSAGRLRDHLQQLHEKQAEYARSEHELHFWEDQDKAWRTKLSEMQEYIKEQRVEMQRALQRARDERVHFVLQHVQRWNDKLPRDELMA